MNLTIDIPIEEWRSAWHLRQFADPDERDVLGMLRLVAENGHRSWWATDTRQLAHEAGGEDDRHYDLLVSPRLVDFAVAAGPPEDIATLTLTRDEADRVVAVTVRHGNASLSVAPDERAYPAVSEVFQGFVEETSGEPSIVVEAWRLAALAHGARQQALPAGGEGEVQEPLLWVAVEGGDLSVSRTWPGLGFSKYAITGEGQGAAAMAVPPSQLSAASNVLNGDVTVRVPRHRAPMMLTDGPRTVLIMAVDPTSPARSHAEGVIAEVFGRHALERDDDGDYPLTVAGIPVYARFVASEPCTLQVFAIVLNGVESNPELLDELNDQNASLKFVRTFCVENQVLVECDLFAGTLDPDEVIAAFEGCRRTAEEIGPVLAAIHGGEQPGRSVVQRWADYRDTVIDAELSPGEMVALNGKDAIQPWPLPPTVWVITAHDPYGRRLSEEVNAAANGQLAAELVGSGRSTIRASGRAADGSHTEDGLLVWDIDRATAQGLGRQFGQEAIFELNAEGVHIIDCSSDRIDSYTRVCAEL